MAEEMESIVEERTALILPSTAGDSKPILRTAYFLKPTFNGSKPPVLPRSLFSQSSGFEPSKCPLKATFCSWNSPSAEWKRWAAQMELKHEGTWKKAGILEAVRASMHETLIKDPELLLSLAQRWSPETNTFVFRWGEATVTLEDVMVIGGYSVLGCSVLAPLETEEMKDTERKLKMAWLQVRDEGGSRRVRSGPWVKRFMGSGTAFEHEAFLALWLSQFVFPQSESVEQSIFPAAIHLARGRRVSLAPPILAAIYRDLSLLKEGIDNNSAATKLNLWALFQLIQVWAWERFPTISPNTNPIRKGLPRISSWLRRKSLTLPNVRSALDSGAEFFIRRPYARSCEGLLDLIYKFYPDRKMWVSVDCDSDDADVDLLSFARFVMPCHLEGLDGCVEQYRPHRVAMQFGMDQDLPCSEIGRRSKSDRPITNMKLYIPSRFSEAGISTRYLKWWEESKVSAEARFETGDVGQFEGNTDGIELSVPPGFEKKWNYVEEPDLDDSSNPESSKVIMANVQVKTERSSDLDVPPGFEKKWNYVEKPDLDGSSNSERSKVLMANVQVKTEGSTLSVPPGFEPEQKENDIRHSGDSFRPNDSEFAASNLVLKKIGEVDSSDEDQKKKGSIENSAGNAKTGESLHLSTHHAVSLISDYSHLTGKKPISEGDNVGIPSERGVDAVERSGRRISEIRVMNLKHWLSEAERFLMEYRGSIRAQRD